MADQCGPDRGTSKHSQPRERAHFRSLRYARPGQSDGRSSTPATATTPISYNDVTMSIHLLPDDVVEKIAAGEVIERPASVARELIENSLDAGASHIRVRIVNGGLSEIQVSDDGCGIPYHEVSLAFQRHATSKLAAFEDLSNLRTLGFRGEALASIAAVADVTLATRFQDEPVGSTARYRFGESESLRAEAVAAGTTVTVRDLFANLPARRKFLRKPSTEGQQVATVVARYAIAHPEIAFSMHVDGRLALQTLGSDLLDALRRTHGPETADVMLPFEDADSGLRIFGFAGPPSLHRSSSRQVDIFVNGRWVQDRVLARAIAEAYRGLLPTGRFPVIVLLAEIPPDRVDVNVHPAKAEVRFADPDKVFQVAYRAVHTVISDPALVPVIAGLEAGAFVPWRLGGAEASADSAQFPQHALYSQAGPDAAAAAGRDGPPVALAAGALPPLRVVGQVQQTYIVAEGPDGLYLVDQHAAHERVLFERFLAERQAGQSQSQALLAPITVGLGASRCLSLQRHQARLRELGFEAEPFGNDVALLRAVPAILADRPASLERAFIEVLDAVAAADTDRWLEHSLVRLVCHSAVRAGETLDYAQMREILRALEATKSPRTCPHGRPTMLYLSSNMVAREFRRR